MLPQMQNLQNLQNRGSIARRLFCAAAFLALLPLSWPAVAAEGETARSTSIPGEAEREAIERVLDRRITFDYAEAPLSKVVDDLAKVTGIDIHVAKADLEAEGVETDTPITIRLPAVTVRSGLKLMLESHGLPVKYVIERGVLSLTTEAYAGASSGTRVYDISDLVIRREQTGELIRDFAPLIDTIQTFTGGMPDGPWIDTDGVGADIEPHSHRDTALLAIRQTQAVHVEIAALLNELRCIQRRAKPQLTPEAAANTAVSAALERRIDFDFRETPLHEALAHVAKGLGLTLIIMKADLEAEGVEVDTPITFQAKLLVAREGLQMLFEEAGLPLKLVVEDEVAKITTEAYAGAARSTIVQDVADLIVQVDEEGVRVRDARQLLEMISRVTGGLPDGPWIDIDGEGGDLGFFQADGLEVVLYRQTQAVQREISQFLDDLRRRQQSGSGAPAPRELVEQALGQRLDLDFERVPLRGALEQLAKRLQVSIEVRGEVENLAEQAVTLHVSRMSARRALDRLLPAGLAWNVERDHIVVAPENEISNASELRTYDVADLVVVRTPPDRNQQQGGGWGGGFFRVPPAAEQAPLTVKVDPASRHLAQFGGNGADGGAQGGWWQNDPWGRAKVKKAVVTTDFEPLREVLARFAGTDAEPVSLVNSGAARAVVARRKPAEQEQIAVLLAPLRPCRISNYHGTV